MPIHDLKEQIARLPEQPGDDKSYPHLLLTTSEAFPGVLVAGSYEGHSVGRSNWTSAAI